MLFIQGKWQEASGTEFSSINPATTQSLWTGREAIAVEVDAAVTAAQRALPAWAAAVVEHRAGLLNAFRARLEQEKGSLVRLISAEVGKPVWDAATEVDAMIGKIALSLAALQERRSPKEIAIAGGKAATRYKPHGVMAVYGPFNFPGHIANGQIVPALAAGNTVVFKPSELSPATGEFVVRLWEQAGLPAGVINLVQGGKPTGEMLAKHPGVNGILFTGSLATGVALRRNLVEFPEKILVLELGGNNPLVVHQPADAKAAVYCTIQSAYVSGGQRCTCARRLIVTPGNDEFLARLTSAVRQLRIAAPDADPQPFYGPLINPSAVDRVMWEQQRLLKGGAEALVRAEQLPLGHSYVSPGLVDVTNCQSRQDHEVFGPLLQVIRVASLEAAMEEANKTQYGLVAALLTAERADFEVFYREVRAGLINWNKPTTGASGALPFGGVGRSGNHRPAGSFAVDFCNLPVASLESEELVLPEHLHPGVVLT